MDRETNRLGIWRKKSKGLLFIRRRGEVNDKEIGRQRNWLPDGEVEEEDR